MSYHVEAPRFGFKELPDRILVREDGAYGDHKTHGTPIIDYWYVLEQRIPPTEREIISAHLEQLEVDNAKLREQVDAAHMSRLLTENENESLRELVRFIMHQCNDGNPRCDECINWNGGECVALQRMRELGVEVDE